MTDDLPNVISTASLLLAVVTGLMSFWYAEVTKAIGENEPSLPNEKKTLGRKIAPVFWSKALPLALGSAVIASVFFWRTAKLVVEAMQLIGTGAEYSDLKTAFVATEALMGLLAVVTITLACKLGRKRWRMR